MLQAFNQSPDFFHRSKLRNEKLKLVLTRLSSGSTLALIDHGEKLVSYGQLNLYLADVNLHKNKVFKSMWLPIAKRKTIVVETYRDEVKVSEYSGTHPQNVWNDFLGNHAKLRITGPELLEAEDVT